MGITEALGRELLDRLPLLGVATEQADGRQEVAGAAHRSDQTPMVCSSLGSAQQYQASLRCGGGPPPVAVGSAGAGRCVAAWAASHTDSKTARRGISAPRWTSRCTSAWSASAPGTPILPGDMNCDGAVDLDDVPFFVQAMIEAESFTGCLVDQADMDSDTFINGKDIQFLVDALLSP